MATYFGIAFPFSKSATSFPAQAVDDALIQQSLIQIIMTGRGERVMRPGFGSNAYTFVFENNNLILQETIKAEVSSAIAQNEPRVIVQNVLVEKTASSSNDPTDQDEVIITVQYVVIATRSVQTVTVVMPA